MTPVYTLSWWFSADEFYKRLFDRSEAFNNFFSGDMKKKGMVRHR